MNGLDWTGLTSTVRPSVRPSVHVKRKSQIRFTGALDVAGSNKSLRRENILKMSLSLSLSLSVVFVLV